MSKIEDNLNKEDLKKIENLKSELPKDEKTLSEEDTKLIEERAKTTEPTTVEFTKVNALDIDTFEIITDQKTFDSEGKRIGFVRTVIFQDYTGDQTLVSKVVIQ